MIKAVRNIQLVLVILSLVAIAPIAACGGGSPPTYPADAAELAVQTIIDQHPVVTDASVTQHGEELDLIVVVVNGTQESAAIEIGDNFVRLVKSLGPDDGPGTDIGKGIYLYDVGVFYPDAGLIVRGVKRPSAEKITW